MDRWVLCSVIALSFILPVIGHADVSPELEEIIQQLDWDMTRQGRLGQHARNRAVTKLVCIAKMGFSEKDRVFKTVGRLLDHENPVVVEAAWRIISHLKAQEEIDLYRQSFLIRNGYPSGHGEILTLVNHLLAHHYKGIEFITGFYPDPEEVQYMNQLARIYSSRSGYNLKIRLRVFNLEAPSRNDRYLLDRIEGELTQDFHHGEHAPTDYVCK